MEYLTGARRNTETQVVMNCFYWLALGRDMGDLKDTIKKANSVKLTDAEIAEIVENIKRYKQS